MTDAPAIEIALVEDDAALREATCQTLTLEGMQVHAFADARTALGSLTPDFPGVVVSDVRMPGMDGIAFFDRLRAIDDALPVILVTGHGDVGMAVAAMKNGAADFLTKPFASAALVRSIRTAADKRALVLENRALRRELERASVTRPGAGAGAGAGLDILGSSATARQLRSLVEAVAGAQIDVVVEGARGTGKSAVARLIHELGPRAGRPFVTVDAGIIAHEDAELLLFGREPGSGSGSGYGPSRTGLSRTGLLERANGGTLFLDELQIHSERIHSRLLAMLDSRSVLPIGAERARKLNLRIVVARSLASADHTSQQASLRPLEQRLGAVTVTLPALSERRSDVLEIFRGFVRHHERDLGVAARDLADADWRYLQHHDWPGNLRELHGYARAFVLGLAPPNGRADAAGTDRSLQELVADFERSLLEDGLRQHQGNVALLGSGLKIARKTLYDKLARHGIRPNAFKPD